MCVLVPHACVWTSDTARCCASDNFHWAAFMPCLGALCLMEHRVVFVCRFVCLRACWENAGGSMRSIDSVPVECAS